MERRRKDKLEDRRQTILLFRWLIVLTSLLLMVYSTKGFQLTSPGYLLVAFFVMSNVGLMFVPRKVFEQTRFIFAVLGIDIALVSLVIYMAGGAAIDLYLLYLLIIFAALPASTMSVSIVVAVVACVFHASMTYVVSGKASLFEAAFLIKIPFLFAAAMFGSLIARQRAELTRQREENERLSGELKRKLVKAKKSKEKLYEDVLMLYDYNDTILNSLDCGVMVIDLNGTVTAFNRAAGAITGLRCDDVLFSEAALNRTLEGFVDLMNKSLEKPVRRRVLPIETPSGQRKIIGISTYLLKQKKEKIGGVISIFADLTEDRDIKEISTFSVNENRNVESLSMNELIDEVVDSTMMKAEECHATIEWSPKYALPDVSVDQHQLRSVLSNMILSSLQMVGGGGRIEVLTERTDKGVVTEVVGDGPEIENAIQVQLFCPFANPIEDELPDVSADGEGSDSDVQFTSDHVLKTEDDNPQAARAYTRSSDRQIPTERTGRKGATILVADNDGSVRTFYKVILEKAGHNVLLAQDGGEAIRQVVGGGVDLLILELRMPRVDGIQVIEHVSKTNPDMPIVVCTGYTAMQDDCRTRSQNVMAYLTKPVSIFEFQKTIEGVLKTSTPKEPALAESIPAGEPSS